MVDMNSDVFMEFNSKLNEILRLELLAGNKICEVYKGDWPLPHCIMVVLDKPFMTPIQRDMETIVFRNLNDPHYWKAEYIDKINNLLLCCKFDGPNFEPL